MEEFDPYDIPTGSTYAQQPVVSPTMAVLFGAANNTVEEEANKQRVYSPAFVAAEKARQERQTLLELTKQSGEVFAKQGNLPALQLSLQEANNLQQPFSQSFVDDVSVAASGQLEELMARTGLPPERIIALADRRSKDLAVRAALEIAISSMEERGGFAQFAQDVIGATTAEDWTRASPIINKFNEKLGFSDSRALTMSGAAENFYKALRNVSDDDRPKIIQEFANRLVDVIGEKDARRVLTIVSDFTSSDAGLEAIFGGLDVLGITAIVKGASRAVLRASRPIAVAKDIGAEAAVAADLSRKLAEGKSTLNATELEALEASLTTKLGGDAIGDLSSATQEELKNRIATLLKEVDNSLYTGGANQDEVLATKYRLERIYSKENNPSIVESSVSANVEKGRADLNVLYGDASGKGFASAEEAIAYWKNWKAGNLEVVTRNGTNKEVVQRIEELDAKITTLLAETTKAPTGAAGRLDLPHVGRLGSVKFQQELDRLVTEGKEFRLGDIADKLKGRLDSFQSTIMSRIIDSLPPTTKIIVARESKGTGIRAHAWQADNRVVLYNKDSRDPNVLAHELMHAATTARIDFGLKNPSSSVGDVVKRMEKLRQHLFNEVHKIPDPQMRGYATYLVQDLYEFSTMGMWYSRIPQDVAKWMESIPYQNTSVLNELWSLIKQLFGFKDNTTFSEWVKLTQEMTSIPLEVKSSRAFEGKSGTIYDAKQPPVYTIGNAWDDKLKQLEDLTAERVTLSAVIEKPEYFVRQKIDVPVFLDDIGNISRQELETMHLTLGKLNPRLASANAIYSPALMSMFKKTKLGRQFGDFVSKSFDKLNAASIDKVNKALIETEKLKRDMKVSELDLVGVRTPDEQEAYYAFRTMRNIQYMYKERAMRDAFVSRGYNNVFVGLDALGNLSGPALVKSSSDLIGKRVYDVEKGGFATITAENVKEFEARGLKFYEYAQGQQLNGIKSAIKNIAVPVNQHRVGDVMNVVGRVDGAYSRIYNEEFFIKIKGKQLIDDAEEEVTYAFRTAATEQDAEKYVAALNSLISKARLTPITADDVVKAMGPFEKDAQKLADEINGWGENTKATFNYDRLEDNYFRNVMGIGSDDKSGGRVFWSKRNDNALTSISTGSLESMTKGPLESLSAEIANTSNFVGLGEWRRVAIQRWYNTFSDVISESDKLNAKTAEDVFFNVVNNVKGYALDQAQARRMLAMKDFIIAQLGVQTADEMAVQNFIRRVTNSVNFPGFSHVGKLVRKYDLPEFLKSVNSTLMLGLFSTAQLVVQASGMALATTISPKHGLKAAYSIRPILGALTSDNPSVWKWFHKVMDVAQFTGMKQQEFIRVAEAIKKVGLLDNVGASSVYNNADGALNIFSKHRRKFNNYQMMFFNKGEEINRVGSFEIARREFIEANPGVAWDSNEALQKIVQRADDLTMNMTRVNEARYNQGWVGIPFQFLQHNIRLGTNIAAAAWGGTKSFSRADAFKLLIGSYVLYGINNNATPDFIEEALGNSLNDVLNEEQKQYLTQGLIAGVLSTIGETITGERTNIAVGTRLSSIQWYEDVADALVDLFKGEGFDGGALFGPTGSTLLALWELPKTFSRFISKEEWTAGDFMRTVSSMGASMSATWRNVDKAYWAFHANGMLMNKKGDATAQLTTPELIIQALGFSSTESAEANTLFRTEKEYKQAMQSYANTIVQYNQLALKAYLAGDSESERINMEAASAVLAPLPYADTQYIQRLLRERTSYDTTLREAMNKWWTTMSSRANKFLVNNPYGEPDE